MDYHYTLLNFPAESSSVLKKIISRAVCTKRSDIEYSAEVTITLVLVNEGHECVKIHISLLAAYNSDYQGLDVIMLKGNADCHVRIGDYLSLLFTILFLRCVKNRI